MKGNLPNWVYCLQILMLFNYMTFDALDGKQARRRKKLSKVGELLDHSGDAFSDAFMALIMVQALKLNTIFERMIILFSFQVK
jgi:phosphatidylglycerophosphate synthase